MTARPLAVAEHPSKCACCGEWIQPGDRIALDDEGDWVHEDCGE